MQATTPRMPTTQRESMLTNRAFRTTGWHNSSFCLLRYCRYRPTTRSSHTRLLSSLAVRLQQATVQRAWISSWRRSRLSPQKIFFSRRSRARWTSWSTRLAQCVIVYLMSLITDASHTHKYVIFFSQSVGKSHTLNAITSLSLFLFLSLSLSFLSPFSLSLSLSECYEHLRIYP